MDKTHKEKLRDAGIARYGSEEAWRQAMKEFGAKADRSTPRGFSKMDKELQVEISKKGGHARWNKQKTSEETGRVTKEDGDEDRHFTKKELI